MKMVGRKAAAWSGGQHADKSGYVCVLAPDHPTAGTDGYAREHRMVYYDTHGALPPGMQVHHIDGNRTNNRPENLIAATPRAHKKIHQFAARVVSLLIDAKLYAAARESFLATGEVPDLAELTRQVYGAHADAPTAAAGC